MNDVCFERHMQLDKRMERVDNTLISHDKRIEYLEQKDAANEIKFTNLCDTLKMLVSVLKWLIGTLFLSMLGFFIWYVQHL